MEKYLRNGSIYAVIEAKDQFHVINCGKRENESVSWIAAYDAKWQAENHAIAGCPCSMQWHYYHGKRHEADGPLGT